MYLKKKAPLVAALLAVSVVAACGGSDDAGSEAGETIRIGVVAPMSGAQAEIGENVRDGAMAAAELLNKDGGVNGKKLEIVVQDEQGTPETAAAAVRKHANDGANLQLGMASSANCLAVAPTLKSLKATFISTACANDALTGQDGAKAPHENFFRVAVPDAQIVKALSSVIAEKYPDVTSYQSFAYDYVTGKSQWGHFKDDIKSSGIDIKVARETWVPLSEQSYGPLVSALVREADKSDGKSGLYLGTFGAGTGSFLQQAEPFNISEKFEFIATPGGYYPVARTLNGKAPQVWNSYDYNYAAYDSDMNKDFVEIFEKKTGKKPVDWSYNAFLGVLAYAAAIDAADSTDSDAVAKALRGVSFDSPQGEITIDAKTQQADGNSVVTLSKGDSSAPEGVKILETVTRTAAELK